MLNETSSRMNEENWWNENKSWIRFDGTQTTFHNHLNGAVALFSTLFTSSTTTTTNHWCVFLQCCKDETIFFFFFEKELSVDDDDVNPQIDSNSWLTSTLIKNKKGKKIKRRSQLSAGLRATYFLCVFFFLLSFFIVHWHTKAMLLSISYCNFKFVTNKKNNK